MRYEELINKRITYIMQHCGSDAGEQQVPGSKLKTQIDMINKSIWELNNLLYSTEDPDAALEFARSLFYHAKLGSAELAFGSKREVML